MVRTEADIIIVGSGVAGALVANELAAAGRDVLVLEAGPRLPRWQTVERFRNQADKSDFMAPYPAAPWAPHPQYGENRNDYLILRGSHRFESRYIRAVGGTTWHWAASCWRFLPSDFKLKSLYGVGRDWPLEYSDLEPWYQRAELALGVWGPADEDLGSPRDTPYPMAPLPLSYNESTVKRRMNSHNPDWKVVTEPVARNSRPYDGRPTCCGNNNCMPICPIGAMYNGIVHVEKAEANGAEVVDSAVVNRIIAGGDRIQAVEYKDAAGESHRVRGNTFVLAANGIETPKLMLLSPSFAHERGIELGLAHLDDVEMQLARGQCGKTRAQLLDIRALLADDDTGAGGMDRDAALLVRTLDDDAAHARLLAFLLDELADLQILEQQVAIVLGVGIPAAVPGAVHLQAHTDRIDFVTH